MKKLILITLFTLILCFSFAKEIQLTQARKVAENLISEKFESIKSNEIFQTDLQVIHFKENLMFAFNLPDNEGFALIAGDDSISPILAYSSASSFDPENVPTSLQWLLDSYSRQIQSIKDEKIEATPEIKSKWAKYSSDQFVAENNRDTVGPLITSIWNQLKYYNTLCPEDEDGYDGHVPVGCVATAMSQIMDYYEFPAQGTGSHTYYADGYGELSANFGETTYNWENIPDFLTDYNEDIQTLGYHCGVSVEMMYSAHGSGAYSSDVLDALQNYFDYSNSMQYIGMYDYEFEEWKDILRTEIDALRPIHYSGYGENSGHAFICDGYDGDDYFHFNWGWDGLFNGYYMLTNLNPRFHDLTDGQSALIGIRPNEGPTSDFSADITTVYTGSSVNFIDQSTQIPTNWEWTFENGNPPTSQEQNPQNIIFENSGMNTVTLSVSNESGTDSTTKFQYITVTNDAEPIADFSLSDSIFVSDCILVLENVSKNNPSNFVWNCEPDNVIFMNETDMNSETPEIIFIQSGTYQITLTAENENGSDSITKTVYIGGISLPYFQDFELSLGNTGWTVQNPDNYYSWDGCYFGGGYENGAKSAYINCFTYDEIGQRDGLISPLINLSNISNPQLTFNHAYAENPTHQDSLIIYISENNTDNWQRIFGVSENGTGNFATHQSTDERFTPSSTDDWSGNGWGADDIMIPLDNWAGSSDFRIMFEVYNDNGNCIFIDDISITGTTSNNDNHVNYPSFEISNFPNPFNPTTTISFELPNNVQNAKLEIFNIRGQSIKQFKINKTVILSGDKGKITWNGNNQNGNPVSSGVYFYQLNVDGNIQASSKCLLLK